MNRRAAVAGAAALALAVAGCSGGAPHRAAPSSPAAPSPAPATVYVAIGASETAGIGASDPIRDAWPQVFYRLALPRDAVFYNLGVPAATTAAAATQELPIALPLQPTVATVWLNFDDLVAGVSPADYEQALGELVHRLRGGDRTRVLVANTPVLDRLPAYAACSPEPPTGSARCPLPGQALPERAVLNQLVADYNAAIARVAAREGAQVVDLNARGEVPVDHPDYVSPDGFHPSSAGHAAIASAFAAAFRAPNH